MPEITSPRLSDDVEADPVASRVHDARDGLAALVVEADPVTSRVHDTRHGLAALIAEAETARRQRAEEASPDSGSAVCAWNHFENIPTFYNWNNRPR